MNLASELEPFSIGTRGIKTDPTVGSVVTVLAVSLTDRRMSWDESSIVCRALEVSLDAHEPWIGRRIACGADMATGEILVALFGAWLPEDFVPLMRRVRDWIILSDEDDPESPSSQGIAGLMGLIRTAEERPQEPAVGEVSL